MKRWGLVFLLGLLAVPVVAADFAVVEIKGSELDLLHPVSGTYLRTVARAELGLPIPVDDTHPNGTYQITVDGQTVCVDVGAVTTNRSIAEKDLPPCDNSIKAVPHASGRSLGHGCSE